MQIAAPKTLELEVPCPNCGTKTARTLEWLRSHSEFVCRQCGTIVDECDRVAAEHDKIIR